MVGGRPVLADINGDDLPDRVHEAGSSGATKGVALETHINTGKGWQRSPAHDLPGPLTMLYQPLRLCRE